MVKKNMSRRAFLAGVVALSVSGCSNGSDGTDDKQKGRKKGSKDKSEDDAFSLNVGSGASSDASRGLTVNGVSKRIGIDTAKKEFRYLLVDMTFENDLDHDAQVPMSYVYCYQNGVKLSRCTKYSNPNASKTLEPGYSIAVAAAFTLDVEDIPVTVKVKSSKGSDYVFEKTFTISKQEYQQG